MSKTVEVFIQFAHPQRFIVKDKQIAEEFRARFGGQLLGKRAWLSTIRRGSSSTLMVVNVEPGAADRYPLDETEIIRAVGNALHVRKEYGADQRWTFAGWECWYAGMRWNPEAWR